MANPAGKLFAEPGKGTTYYEQPLIERMRTFMRLEFLYQQLLYNADSESDWASRATIATLLDILAILSRGDVRSDVQKELDHQLAVLERFIRLPDVDRGRLEALLANLADIRKGLVEAGTNYLQPLKDSEFLSAVKHRSAIPGGTCEFDLPVYSHWLRQSYERRRQDLDAWTSAIRPLCDAVLELLWLIRESAKPSKQVATRGMYQHSVQKGEQCRLLRIGINAGSTLFPEISGSQHRFTVRFLEWQTVEARAVQTTDDVRFQLSIC
ncbi:MAG: cell division protein ZapD [Woeseiaceae bacterium]|jgi:cell division protein ZapD|nr:cell division protein ZapD [Woeseiaceae bacterium]